MKISDRSSNTASGVFAISVFFFLVLLALNHFDPHPLTGWLIALMAIVGLGALGAWTWLSFQIATRSRR